MKDRIDMDEVNNILASAKYGVRISVDGRAKLRDALNTAIDARKRKLILAVLDNCPAR